MVYFLIYFEILQSFAVNARVDPPQVEISRIEVFFFADTPAHNLLSDLVNEFVLRPAGVDHNSFLGDLRGAFAEGAVLFLDFSLFLFCSNFFNFLSFFTIIIL